MATVKKAFKASTKKNEGKPDFSRVKEAHWSRPASFTVDGKRMATLREVLDPTIPTKNLIELSENDRVDLVVKRLETEPDDFKTAAFGVGVIDKHRAIAEVKARSEVGRNLIEIEQRFINHLTKVGQKV